MATSATGTPSTNLAIPKINTAVDPPDGKGVNSIVDAIDTLFPSYKVSGIASGEVPVWNGTTWVRSTTTNIGPTSLGSGTPDSTKFLRGDGSWQVVSTGPTITYALISSPPGSPANGDIWYAVDSTTAPTYQWTFRYNSSSASTYKWEYVGGTSDALYAEVDVGNSTGETTSSATYVALATAGPAITIPRAGDWLIDLSCQMYNNGAGNNQGLMSYDIGATGAVNGDGFRSGNATGTTWYGNGRRSRKTITVANTTLTAKYAALAGTAGFANRRISATPIRII